jgi:hypothetical protein
MRALLILLIVGAIALAQPPGGEDPSKSETKSASALSDPQGTALASPTRTSFISPDRSFQKSGGETQAGANIGIDKNTNFRPGWLKKLTIESLGYGPAPLMPGFDLSPSYTSALFNLSGWECPLCARGPLNRPQGTTPPFGANVTWTLRDGRVELFTGAGGIEAWRPTSNFIFNDAWLTQVQLGGRVAIDHNKRLWFGGTGRYLYNLGPGPKHWDTFGGDATFKFGR